MATQIRLTKNQVADLTVLGEAPLEMWSAVVERTKTLSPHPMKPDKLRAALSEVAESSFIDTLIRQAFALSGMMLQINLRIEQVFEGLRSALIRAPANWKEEMLSRWDERTAHFQAILCAEVILGTAKALDLSYEHAQLLRRARILTDIRPVFNREGSTIQGVVVSQTLRLRYDDLEGEHSVSLALDKSDIENLIEEGNRALAKCETVLGFMAQTKVPTLVPGSDA